MISNLKDKLFSRFDQEKLNKEVDRGRQADELLNHPIYLEVTTTLESKIIQAWTESPTRDKEGQFNLRLLMECLKAIKSNIEEIAETGKLAKLQIEQEEKSKRKKKKL